MELSGNLSDFALTDILQILALSRKSGTLSLESGNVTGMIVIERGRITHASMTSGETISARLVREELVRPEVMSRLREIGRSGVGGWSLNTLLVESGVISQEAL
ncbi:MAG TPA: DUF4388 domain-containing protein, partial [Blastocatellia bacterium]|nr:DUF4388 domain-containing protein [Blastocatellia bacterium]